MSTTIATPSAAPAPAAAPSSAPSSAPSPAPVSSPATPPPAAPPVAPPAAPAPVEAPAPAAAPAAAPAGKPEPKSSDFANDAQGQEAFLNEHMAWEREKGGAEVPPVEETKPPVEEPKPAEGETKPIDPESKEAKEETELAELAEPQPVTPESITKWTEQDPAFKSVLAANPKLNGELHAMARVNAKASEMLKIYPNAEAARFANQTAGQLVNMRSAFAHAVDEPETFPQAYEQFAENFMVRDKEGKPVLDQAGMPTFDQDFHMLNNHTVDSWIEGEIEDFRDLVKASPDDEDLSIALSALEHVRNLKTKREAGPQPPDKSMLTPEQRAWQEQVEADLKARGEKLEGQNRAQTQAEKKTERANYTAAVNRKIGSAVGKTLDTWLADKAQNDVFLPTYVTDAKNKDGQSIFAIQIFNEFNEKVMSVAHYRDQLAALERLPPSPENEKLRVNFYTQLTHDLMPDIMDAQLRQVQRTEIADRKRRQGNAEKRSQVAVVEPLSGSASSNTQTFTEETAMAQAYKNVDAKYGDTVSRVDRTVYALNEKNRLMASR